MAKKKKNKQQCGGQQHLSPERFIRERMRSVKIGKCYMSTNQDLDQGGGYVVVTREHTGGRISVAVYLVDIWCTGVHGCLYRLRIEDYELDDMLENFGRLAHLEEVSYEEAHNMVWGCVAYAEEAGIAPCKDFALAKYFLEDDTDDIPLIEYEYGKDGKYFLVANNNMELTKYLPLLKKNLGEDEYSFVMQGGDSFVDLDKWDRNGYPRDEYPYYYGANGSPYTYRGSYPKQPDESEFPEVNKVFASPDNRLTLPDAEVDRILALPHDKLRRQLEHMIMWGLGVANDGKGGLSRYTGEVDQIIMHSVIFLGHLGGGEESLRVVLETLRQPEDVMDYLWGDGGNIMVTPAIASLGKDSLPLLHDFILEEGIIHSGKWRVFEAVADIITLYPEKREAAIEWFSTIIDHILDGGPEASFTDYSTNGILVGELLHIHAEELLPKIKQMYDRNLVERDVCGNWENVEKDMMANKYHKSNPITDIKQAYCELDWAFGGNL
jgi:hypothetical protein